MTSPDVTCWSMIRDAAGGDPAARERFARVYLPVVKAYLAARWRGTARDADDAAQDVFVECFRSGGLLAKADPERDGGFRAFLLGAVRNVARRHETRTRRADPLPDNLQADDTGPAEAFERAWARALLREAARAQDEAARKAGPAAERRVTLRTAVPRGLPIRDIAARWRNRCSETAPRIRDCPRRISCCPADRGRFPPPRRAPSDLRPPGWRTHEHFSGELQTSA